MSVDGRVLAFSGGIGGARLAVGLAQTLPSRQLSIVANTGDDFEHLGLHISPDVDTLLYSLAGLNNADTGWGRAGETWSFLSELERLGMPTWFRIGDKDLAVHLYRTNALRTGKSLTAVTGDLAEKFGVAVEVMPMSDDRVRTVLDTNVGRLDFQDYFVRRQCRPKVSAIRFEGAEQARPSAALMKLLRNSELRGIVLCPSNPFLSIDPILSIPGLAGALAEVEAPIVAITPIVGGAALKGPTAKIMCELGLPVSPAAIAEHYGGLIDGFILDVVDERQVPSVAASGVAVETANTVMRSLDDRVALAQTTLAFLARLRHRNAARRNAL